MIAVKTQKSNSMKNRIDVIGFLLGWFSIFGQFFLMMQNRQTAVVETIIRFFSFFTILTNIIVALYFTSRIAMFYKVLSQKTSNKGTLTALTTFILVVGLV